jgi:hypothetical protein
MTTTRPPVNMYVVARSGDNHFQTCYLVSTNPLDDVIKDLVGVDPAGMAVVALDAKQAVYIEHPEAIVDEARRRGIDAWLIDPGYVVAA